jgi:DNA invertase Pin-like site-specific DNA recombinase
MNTKYHNKRFVQYARVSTDDQTNGIEAQKRQMDDFVKKHNGTTIKIFEEYKSGGDNKRKGLADAIDFAQKEDAILLVSKLDRLARNARFILEIKERKIDFVIADNPEMGELMLGILASFAQEERRLISERTKAGIRSVQLSGKKVGGNHWKEVPINLINSNKERGLRKREELKSFVIKWKNFLNGDPEKLIELLENQEYKNHYGNVYNLGNLRRLGILDFLNENS